jgi:hypothetical protein
LDVEPEVAFRDGRKQKVNMKKLQIAILAISLAGAMSASATLLVNNGLPYVQPSSPSTDVSWADEELSASPSGGYWDTGGSFSIGGSGTYTVTGITVWDVVNTSAGAPTGLSLLNASGSTISSGYTATLGTYGNGVNYVPENSGYPLETLYQLNFTVDVPVSAGSPYDFFLDGPLTDYAGLPGYVPSGSGDYFTQFLLYANDAGPDPVLWLGPLGVPGSPSVSAYPVADGINGDAYVQVFGAPVPEPTTAGCFLLGLGALACFQRFTQKRRS